MILNYSILVFEIKLIIRAQLNISFAYSTMYYWLKFNNTIPTHFVFYNGYILTCIIIKLLNWYTYVIILQFNH